MFVTKEFIKKKGQTIAYISRDLLLLEVGDKINSFSQYKDCLKVSKGVVQQSSEYLEKIGAIKTERTQGAGTILTATSKSKLRETANIDILTLCMPIPSTFSLKGLTTAIYELNDLLPAPLAFVYAVGAKNRINYLRKNMYDMILTSKATADEYLKIYDFLDKPIYLTNMRYTEPYHLFFSNPKNKEIKDGMKVGIDYACTDLYNLTMEACEGKQVELIDGSYPTLAKSFSSGAFDAIISRKEYPMNEFNYLKPIYFVSKNTSEIDLITPTLLFNKENYGIRNMIWHYLDVGKLAATQNDVDKGKKPVKFY